MKKLRKIIPVIAICIIGIMLTVIVKKIRASVDGRYNY